MSISIQPIRPHNAFYQNFALIERRQEALVARVEAIATNLPAPTVIEDAIAGLTIPVIELGAIVAASSADQVVATNRATAATEKSANALDRIIRLVEIERRPEQRASVSRLFLGVNVDGDFTRNSSLGEMLIDASNGAVGLAMDPPIPRRKRVTRAEFVERGLRHAAIHGFGGLDAEHFADFYDQAPHVLKAIRQGAAPPLTSGAD